MSKEPLTDETKGGHTLTEENVTASTTDQEEAQTTLDVFVLLKHAFFMAIFSETPENILETYLSFTKEILTLYHGKYDQDEIRSALIIAEDHLSIITEDSVSGCEVSIRFAGRAIRFLKQYIQLIAEKCVAHGIAEKKEVVEESKPALSYTFKFKRPFNQFVELIDSIINIKCIEDIENGEIKKSTFIRLMLDMFGFGHKSLQDYRAARNKLYQKAPPPGQGRCKMLPDMQAVTEKIWEEKYFGSN